MGRNKIAIAHIKSDASRAVTYSKRKKGLLKKVKELAVLCGVEVCLMCHPQVGAPLTWGTPGVAPVIARYKSLACEEREKRKLDNTTLLHHQLQKLTADLHHLVDQNRKLADNLESPLWDDRLNAYGLEELEEVANQLLLKKEEVADHLAHFSNSAQLSDQQVAALALNQEQTMSFLQQRGGGSALFLNQMKMENSATSCCFGRPESCCNAASQATAAAVPPADNYCTFTSDPPPPPSSLLQDQDNQTLLDFSHFISQL
jgi:hypothetical protein